MSDQEKQESQKTIVAFAAGLLVGGMLVWIFGGSPTSEMKKDENTGANKEEVQKENVTDAKEKTAVAEVTTNKMIIGEGKIEVVNQKAGNAVALTSTVYPTDEGWIGVRDYKDGQALGLLGVARYSKEQGLLPETVQLQRTTVEGKEYALVFYSENGDRVFSLAEDTQIEGFITSFKAE